MTGRHHKLLPGSNSWLPWLCRTQAGWTLLAGKATCKCLSGMATSRG